MVTAIIWGAVTVGQVVLNEPVLLASTPVSGESAQTRRGSPQIPNEPRELIQNDTTRVELIRTFDNKKELEEYVGKPKESQTEVSSVPTKMFSKRTLNFLDAEGQLLSTYSFDRCRISQSPNKKYSGVLEYNEDFTQLKYTLFDQSGQIRWQKDIFHPTFDGSFCNVYIRSNGQNVISATIRFKTAPYSILFHDSEGNVIKEYRETKNADEFDFHMAAGRLSANSEYFVVAGEDGVYAFDWNGELTWKYEFATSVFMRVAHEIHISPNGKYVTVIVDEHPTEEEMHVCLYFLSGDGRFIGKYDEEYLHGWSKFSKREEHFAVATRKRLFLFEADRAKKVWQYEFEDECLYVPSLTFSPNGEWIILGRNISDTEKDVYLFNISGEKLWLEEFEGADLGDLNQPTLDLVDDGNKVAVEFPNKIFLFEIQKGR
jgi:outer membrane protein assembly factor BamB